MKKSERKALIEYLRWVADEMGLRDWRFEVFFVDEHEMPKGGLPHEEEWRGLASALPIPGQHRANIHFLNSFRKNLTADKQREVVAHELIHCHLADMREFIRQGILNMVAQQTYDAISYGFDLAWEHAVDAMARPWAEKLPMIDWPK